MTGAHDEKEAKAEHDECVDLAAKLRKLARGRQTMKTEMLVLALCRAGSACFLVGSLIALWVRLAGGGTA